jgi:O-methyltransferase
MLQPNVSQAIDYVIANQITFCAGNFKLHKLATCMQHIEAQGVPGRVLEVGVAMGGSAIVLAHAKAASRPLDLYDVFTMLPAPTAADGAKAQEIYQYFLTSQPGNQRDFLYKKNSAELDKFVLHNLANASISVAEAQVTLHKGDVKDTLHPQGPVALFHIDCDWVEPMQICLDRTAHLISPGGIIVFDDYSSFSGCHDLIDDWLGAHPDFSILSNTWSVAVQRNVASPDLIAQLQAFETRA